MRFSGEASEQGLTTFLDAFDESSHWVLVAPLSPGLLPFKKCRVAVVLIIRVFIYRGFRKKTAEIEQAVSDLAQKEKAFEETSQYLG